MRKKKKKQIQGEGKSSSFTSRLNNIKGMLVHPIGLG